LRSQLAFELQGALSRAAPFADSHGWHLLGLKSSSGHGKASKTSERRGRLFEKAAETIQAYRKRLNEINRDADHQVEWVMA
jgi:hypothetical protein